MEDNVRVIDRAFDILEALAANGSSMGLSEICRATGISKSTVYRLISTMHNRHYVEKNPDNTYSIGYKLICMPPTNNIQKSVIVLLPIALLSENVFLPAFPGKSWKKSCRTVLLKDIRQIPLPISPNSNAI